MNRKRVIICFVIIVLVILLCPIPSQRNLSGVGEILTLEKEKIGTCNLEIEITEVASLVICYKRNFKFSIDGNVVDTFSTTSYSEAKGICLLSQMYYDKEIDEMRLASLTYSKDLLYVVLDLGSNYYFLNNGSNLTYAELPLYE